MTVESASYISQLDAALPAAGDQKSEGDDHFRLIKSVLKTQFPNFGTTAITTTAAEVNYLSGVTSAIQTQINSKAALASPALTGVPTAPTAAPGTNTTQLATTAFVAAVLPVDSATVAAASKATPVDADLVPLIDSAASNVLKKLTWANLKATLATWIGGGTIAGSFTTLAASGNTTLGDAEATDTHAVKGATTLLANSASAALTVTQTGAGNAFVVEDSASADSTPFVITADGTAVVGATASFPGIFGNSANLEVASVSAHPVQFGRFANDIFGTDVQILKSRNATPGAHTIVQSGDSIGAFYWGGSDGTNYIPSASVLAQVDGTPGTNDMPGRLVFSTTADGASNPTERMRIDSSGNVLVTNSAGLGYGTSAGGTVTQATSRTTGVTLSKPTGSITLVSAAGSATAASFTVTNTLVAATDTIIICQKSGTDLYEIHITAVAAGSFRVTFKTTGGTTTEQPVFNFAVIKGVTA